MYKFSKKVNQQELVSIITPTYNSSEFIEETIYSVLNQTYENWELILVDDCSSDNTIKLISNFAEKDKRILILKNEKNEGAAISRNKAIKIAKGRFIAFLDSDDLWFPSKLEKQVEFSIINKFALTYSAYQKISEDGSLLGIISVPKKVSYKSILKTCSIGCLTAMYDTSILGKIYMPNIRKRQDYGLWLKILKKIDFAHGMNEILAQYRVRKNSISSNKLKAAKYQWKVYREVENLSLLSSIYYFINYFIYGTLKTYFK